MPEAAPPLVSAAPFESHGIIQLGGQSHEGSRDEHCASASVAAEGALITPCA